MTADCHQQETAEKPAFASDCDLLRGLERKLPGQDSNLDKANQKPLNPRRNFNRPNTSSETSPRPDRALTKPVPIDSDLEHVLAAWPNLPVAIKAAVLALVDAAASGAK
jgi:hypothetical protein